jgi:SnoaL-like domain
MTAYLDTPAPIAAMIAATNAADSDAFVAVFTDDAYLNDWGREFHGHSGIASWNRTDNIGVEAHFDLHGVRAGDADDEYLADLTVTSRRFNGDGTFTISLRDRLISRFVIG